MQKHSTHVIDEQAVHIFKGSLPPEHWTIYDIRPDYGKDHKVELVEGGEHTGMSFWVQVKGQKRVKKLRDGTISFKLETKDLDYHTRLQAPVFLVVVDVTNRVGYWVFTQRYERTHLHNVAWRGQDHIQIRLPALNTLSKLKPFREAVGEAIRYMTRLTFTADLGLEERRLEEIDSRFTLDITVGTAGRRYDFHSDEMIPIEFSYPEGSADSGKIVDLVDRGLPIVVRNGEIQVDGSPLFDFFFEMAGDGDVRLEANLTIEGFANLVRKCPARDVEARIEAIPCRVICGQREARIEACLPLELLALKVMVPYGPGGTRPMKMPIDLSAWRGLRLMNLPFFDQLHGIFAALGDGDRLAFECVIPGQRFLSGTMNFEEEHPYRDISLLVEMLAKARAVAALRSLNPKMPEDFGTGQSFNEIQLLYDILLGEGHQRLTPSTRIETAMERHAVEKFVADMPSGSLQGTLSFTGEGSFGFLGESVHIEALERINTDMQLVNSRQSLLEELKRSPSSESFHLDWRATDTTQTTLLELRVAEELSDRGVS